MPRDTQKHIEQIYIQRLKQKTESERAHMGFSMFEAARYLVKSSIVKKGMTTQDIKIAVFNRFYGNDFNAQTREKILRYLAGSK